MRASVILLFLAVLIGWYTNDVQADEDKDISTSENHREIDVDEYMALLEFLGEWEIDDKQYMDPEDLDQMPLNDKEPKNGKED